MLNNETERKISCTLLIARPVATLLCSLTYRVAEKNKYEKDV